MRWSTGGNERKRKCEWGNERKKMEKGIDHVCEWQGPKGRRERERGREDVFSNHWEKMKDDGKRGAG